MVEDEGLDRWIEWLIVGCGPQGRLWPGPSAGLTKTFALVLGCLGLSQLPLTPDCLRPGGATRLFLPGSAIRHLKYKGLWGVESSLEVYAQEAM